MVRLQLEAKTLADLGYSFESQFHYGSITTDLIIHLAGSSEMKSQFHYGSITTYQDVAKVLGVDFRLNSTMVRLQLVATSSICRESHHRLNSTMVRLQHVKQNERLKKC